MDGKMGSVHGEELPFVFGAALVDGFAHFPRNYTRSEMALSESIIQYFANFARTGLGHELHKLDPHRKTSKLLATYAKVQAPSSA
uniref:Carboxylesterase type B domain-containing protein n=1 Tax=Vespula pensylvanica TaxID=30213 RepID=A0A834NYS5_VESPE|nr:hypothetical protein H0235_009451 [Vespula pensylvanica]